MIVVAIVNAMASQSSGRYLKKDRLINLFAMVFMHIQLLIGAVLYFQSPWVQFSEGWISDARLRFYGLEHLLGMLLAIVLITLGRKKAEKLRGTRDKHRRILFSYLIALILILVSIPWPFREVAGNWF
jgi:hypothetical protein